jgi:hypothetical protein
MAYIGGGDLNKGLQGWSDFWDDLYTLGGVTTGGGYQPVHLGMDLNGEILFQITPQMGIGLGAGFISASKASALTLTTPSESEKETWEPKATVIPITLNFHFSIPAGSSLKFNIHAGIGYYLASVKHTQHVVFFGVQDEEYDMSGNGFGAHGGFGLEVALSPNVGFTFDILGRFASVSSLSGDRTVTSSGTSDTESGGKFWYGDFVFSGLGTYPFIAYDTALPATLDNGREAKLDLSGFSAVAGFIFRF